YLTRPPEDVYLLREGSLGLLRAGCDAGALRAAGVFERAQRRVSLPECEALAGAKLRVVRPKARRLSPCPSGNMRGELSASGHLGTETL
ncbi:hypothetical protein, partial [Ferrimicrobium sp.]|uniref:hypothetical protein n=1 Tax=Ferrimicrobium sp. TaxID=2926050 RepID=UPI0026201195